MKKHYTKRQIIESIKHWQNVLKMMNESVYNAVIDALVDEFGKDVVLSTKFDYTLTQQDLKKIFSILNLHLFDNKIKYLPVVLWPMEKLVDKLNYHAKMSGSNNEDIKAIKCLGVHSSICTEVYNSNNEIVDIKIRDHYLIINSSEIINNIFIFVIAVICHEMIHAYDQQSSNEVHDLVLNWEKYHEKEPEVHQTRIFKDKMKEANENGINVVPVLSSDESHFTDNIHARYVLKSVIGEIENPDVEVIKGKQNLYFHNKKTGYGYFIHFD